MAAGPTPTEGHRHGRGNRFCLHVVAAPGFDRDATSPHGGPHSITEASGGGVRDGALGERHADRSAHQPHRGSSSTERVARNLVTIDRLNQQLVAGHLTSADFRCQLRVERGG